jgi:hypothetical protein
VSVKATLGVSRSTAERRLIGFRENSLPSTGSPWRIDEGNSHPAPDVTDQSNVAPRDGSTILVGSAENAIDVGGQQSPANILYPRAQFGGPEAGVGFEQRENVCYVVFTLA